MYQKAIVGKKKRYCFFENSQLIKIRSKYPLDLKAYLDLKLGHKMGRDVTKTVFGVCEQHKRRSACAYAQSDQRLCFSLFGKYHIQTCYKWNFNFLDSPCN